MAAGKELTPTDYISHHLTHGAKPVGDGGFWTLHVDTLVVVDPARHRRPRLPLVGRARRDLRRARQAPGLRRAAVRLRRRAGEGHLPPRRPQQFVAPPALTVFVWVLLMNAMDFLPVDIVAWARTRISEHGFRIVPTADVNTTFALALSVWLLMICFAIEVKGLGGWIHELFCAPFGSNPLLWPVEPPVQPRRVRLQAAVALAAAVRQHVRGRDHLPAALDVGGDRPGRHDLRRRARRWAGRSSTS